MTINNRIKKVRQELGLSQVEFANKLGVRQSSLSYIENGITVNIDERNIKIICSEFGVNENWLRTGEGTMFDQAGQDLMVLLGENVNQLTDIEKKAVAEFIKLPSKHRKIIMGFIQKMTT